LARIKDELKREKILKTSKILFSQQGYANTSVSDIVQATNMPVGTIYTYFGKKEEIICTIVDEGWSGIQARLEKLTRSGLSGKEKLRLILDDFVPELLKDLNFINILLTEAIELTKVEEKMETITDVVLSIVKEISGTGEPPAHLSRRMLQTSIVVVFLGLLSAANLAKTGKTGIYTPDIIAFLKYLVSQSLGIEM